MLGGGGRRSLVVGVGIVVIHETNRFCYVVVVVADGELRIVSMAMAMSAPSCEACAVVSWPGGSLLVQRLVCLNIRQDLRL